MRRAVLSFPLLALCSTFAALLIGAGAAAETSCTATRTQRAVPGGGEQPSLQIECDDPRDASEAAPASVCDAVPSEERVTCEKALDRRLEALRRARLRGAAPRRP